VSSRKSWFFAQISTKYNTPAVQINRVFPHLSLVYDELQRGICVPRHIWGILGPYQVGTFIRMKKVNRQLSDPLEGFWTELSFAYLWWYECLHRKCMAGKSNVPPQAVHLVTWKILGLWNKIFKSNQSINHNCVVFLYNNGNNHFHTNS